MFVEGCVWKEVSKEILKGCREKAGPSIFRGMYNGSHHCELLCRTEQMRSGTMGTRGDEKGGRTIHL